MGLDVRSNEKFVPKQFLFASYRQRLQLLRGLMDTDGYSGESPEFSSTSKALAEAVVFLIQSFGGTASITFREETSYTYKGEKLFGLPSYRVVPSLAGINPFSLPRKRDLWKSPSRGVGRWIDRIELREKQKTTCIAVDTTDHLYVTEHFIVTHNTVMELAWGENVLRKTNKPVLLLTPLAVGPQMVKEGEKFGIACRQTRDGSFKKLINVTNYEQIGKFSPKDFSGVICDESSILKGVDSQTRRKVTDFLHHVNYRLLATATPSPNDYMELGNSSEAIGQMSRGQMLGMFFTNGGETTQQWTLKGHAKKRFWRWVSTWARALRKPSDLGFDDDGFILPELKVSPVFVDSTIKKPGRFYYEAITLDEQNAERRQTIKERCEKVAELLAGKKHGVAWCHLNSEGDLLEKLIDGAVQVSGADSDEKKEERLTAFSAGQIRVLVTKPKIGGFGLNWQHCNQMTFFPSHSYEAFYQAVRRCWRFGQKHPVNVSIVSSQAEMSVMRNMRRKEQQMIEMFRQLVAEMHDYQTDKKEEQRKRMKLPTWLTGESK